MDGLWAGIAGELGSSAPFDGIVSSMEEALKVKTSW